MAMQHTAQINSGCALVYIHTVHVVRIESKPKLNRHDSPDHMSRIGVS